jgi:hypothetical protein
MAPHGERDGPHSCCASPTLLPTPLDIPFLPPLLHSDTRELLKSASVDDAYAFVDANSHPRLWRNLAEHALEALDFATADKAFVRCADYQVARGEGG